MSIDRPDFSSEQPKQHLNGVKKLGTNQNQGVEETIEVSMGTTEKDKEPEQEILETTREKGEAQRFWKTRLDGEARIEVPQNPNCEFAIVIPVHNENPERILKQIESLRNQGIESSTFEVIYIVNNDTPDGSNKSREIVEANQAVIETLKNIQGLNIFVIDKSSDGNTISDCNVGKARNRGIAEASFRFHENQKNGILIQSDADCYFEDPNYLEKVKNIVKQNPDAIGIAGGLIFEFDPDTKNPEEIEILKQKLEKFTLLREWGFMSRFLRDSETPLLFQGNTFSGAHMLSKSFETAVLGGLEDTAIAEDVNFGESLKAYAAGRGQAVLGKREELLVVTALRESDRTGASFKKYFDEIDLEKPLIGHNPLAPYISEIRLQILDKIKINIHNPIGIREALSDPSGNLLCSEAGLDELITHLRDREGLDITDPFFSEWRQKYFGESDPIQDMYDKLYPEIPITQEALMILESQVLQHPNGQKFIENMRTNLTRVRIKKD